MTENNDSKKCYRQASLIEYAESLAMKEEKQHKPSNVIEFKRHTLNKYKKPLNSNISARHATEPDTRVSILKALEYAQQLKW